MFSLIIIEHAYITHNTYHTTYAKHSTGHTAHMSYTHTTYMLPLSPPIGFHASLLSGCRDKVQSPAALLPTSTAHARQSVLTLHMISEQTRVTQGPGAYPSSQGVQMACLTSEGEYENRVSREFSVQNLTSVAGLSGH